MLIQLNSGAFSNVFEARDLKTGKKVAIKVAQKSHPNDKVNDSSFPIAMSLVLIEIIRTLASVICTLV